MASDETERERTRLTAAKRASHPIRRSVSDVVGVSTLMGRPREGFNRWCSPTTGMGQYRVTTQYSRTRAPPVHLSNQPFTPSRGSALTGSLSRPNPTQTVGTKCRPARKIQLNGHQARVGARNAGPGHPFAKPYLRNRASRRTEHQRTGLRVLDKRPIRFGDPERVAGQAGQTRYR